MAKALVSVNKPYRILKTYLEPFLPHLVTKLLLSQKSYHKVWSMVFFLVCENYKLLKRHRFLGDKPKNIRTIVWKI